jgi:hypothetical protein
MGVTSDSVREEVLRQLEHILKAVTEVKVALSNQHFDNIEYYDRITACTRMASALKRFAPEGSPYYGEMPEEYEYTDFSRLYGKLTALRDDYKIGGLATFKEIVASDISSDYLKMAEHLLESDGLKLPAAVLAGSVLEEHLRNLCTKNNIDIDFTDKKGDLCTKKAATMNDELRQKGVYHLNDHKQITAWYGVRSSAAHGKDSEFNETQVEMMIQGVRSLISRFPA